MRTFLKKNCWPWAKRIGPWLVAAGILGWLFQQYPISQLYKAITLANPVTYAIFAVIYALIIWTTDTYSLAWLISRFDKPIRWTAILPARAASYLMSLINYGAGQAMLGYTIKRIRDIPLGDILAAFLLLTAADFVWIVTLAFIGSFIGEQHHILGVNVAPMVQGIGALTYAAVALHLIFWRMHWEDRLQGALWQRGFAWLRKRSLFRIFHVATLRDYATLFLSRAPIHAMLVLSVYILVPIFQASIDLKHCLGSIPVAVLIGVIPISWGGVGTSQVAMVDLMAPYVTLRSSAAAAVSTEELLLAMGLVWMFTNYFLKFLLGIVFLPRVSKLLRGIPSPRPQIDDCLAQSVIS